MVTLKKSATPFSFAILLGGCIENVDFSGFITTTDPVEERFYDSKLINDVQSVPAVVNISGDEYRVLIAGDSHVGGTKNLNLLFEDARNSSAGFVVLAGDLTTGKAEAYKTLSDFLTYYPDIRCFTIAGNHDLFFDGWKSYKKYFGSSTYTKTIVTDSDSDLWIFLDSGSGTLGSGQVTWLNTLLETQRSNFRYCNVVTHVNFFRPRYTTSTNPNIEELRVLLPLFAKYKVDNVIMGHDHRRNVENFDGTRYIILDDIQDISQAASYLEISVGNKIEINFNEL